MILQAEMASRRETYRHAMYGMSCGLLVQFLLIGGFINLTIIHEPVQARFLLSREVVAVIGTFVNSRIHSK
jgi:hypothetical protein